MKTTQRSAQAAQKAAVHSAQKTAQATRTTARSAAVTAKSAARAVRHAPNSPARHMAIGGTSAILGALVCGLADYLWTYPRIMFLFWFVFGLTLAAIKVCKTEIERV